MTFASPSERLSAPEARHLAIARPVACLSWGCAPLLRRASVCPLPEDVAAFLRPTVANGRRDPPSWFFTTSAGFSTHRFPGLLHPGAGRGSPRFRVGPAACRGMPKQSVACAEAATFLAAPFAPLEEVPPTAAASRHRDRCPLVVGPSPLNCARQPLRRRPSTSGLCSAIGSVAPRFVAEAKCPLLPWALSPSRVLAGSPGA